MREIKQSRSDSRAEFAQTVTLSYPEGHEIQYGNTGIYTDRDGKVYLWLAAGTVVNHIGANGQDYPGDPYTVTSDPVQNVSFGQGRSVPSQTQTQPRSAAANTGDDYNILLWIILLVLSVATFSLLAIRRGLKRGAVRRDI